MTQELIKAQLLSALVDMIIRKYGYSEVQAIDEFYNSSVGMSFVDDSTGLYKQSAEYIFSLFEKEKKQADFFTKNA